MGGDYDGALVVRVSARAVDGRATAARIAAVAAAFGVHPRAVTLLSGAASRTGTVDVDGADPAMLRQLLARLRRDLGGPRRGMLEAWRPSTRQLAAATACYAWLRRGTHG